MAQVRYMAELGCHQGDVDQALARLSRDRILPRIWSGDYTVWKSEPTEIANRLGWLRIVEAMRDRLPRIKALLASAQSDGLTDVLLLGMGGSSLAPEVFQRSFSGEPDGLHLAVLDSTDPGVVLSFDQRFDPVRTLFIVATKSGITVETLSLFNHFYNRTRARVGFDTAGDHFLAITDPNSELDRLAQEYRFRDRFLSDPDIGGRYSALSYYGLAPAILMGVDVEKLLDRSMALLDSCRPGLDAAKNSAALLGTVLGRLALAGRDKMTVVTSPALTSFADWIEQLVAESTGKQGQGILPVVGESLGSGEVYGDDRLFVHIRLDNDDSADAALTHLTRSGHPLVRLSLGDLYDLGGHFFLWELATAVASHLIGVNPFDQPDVDSAKVLAREIVVQYRKTGSLPEEQTIPLTAKALCKFLDHFHPGDYIALQAYLQPTPKIDAVLQSLRRHLRDRYRLATTVGYGPRFLHSTGQLHKGDGGRGLFVQFTARIARDLPIPDRAGSDESSISFGVLQAAQARGDAEALRNAGRRVITGHLGDNPIDQLRALDRDLG